MQPAAALRETSERFDWTTAPTRTLHAVPTTTAGLAAVRYCGWRRHVKRCFDLAATVIVLPIALPMILLIGVMIVISSPGNPIFRQTRVGQGGKTFGVLKFRTMHPDAESRLHSDDLLYARYVANDFKLSAQHDPRIFDLGRFLRRTSLDELPQLFNVLLGQMSLVGPRPVVPTELEHYGPWQDAYLTLRPGITGLWQVNGRNHIRYPARARLDASYLERWTFGFDVCILLKTIPSVVRRHGTRLGKSSVGHDSVDCDRRLQHDPSGPIGTVKIRSTR